LGFASYKVKDINGKLEQMKARQIELLRAKACLRRETGANALALLENVVNMLRWIDGGGQVVYKTERDFAPGALFEDERVNNQGNDTILALIDQVASMFDKTVRAASLSVRVRGTRADDSVPAVWKPVSESRPKAYIGATWVPLFDDSSNVKVFTDTEEIQGDRGVRLLKAYLLCRGSHENIALTDGSEPCAWGYITDTYLLFTKK
jgi:hypothetical protein